LRQNGNRKDSLSDWPQAHDVVITARPVAYIGDRETCRAPVPFQGSSVMSAFAKTNTVERCFLSIAAFGAAILLASSVYYLIEM
jgi:hypothetical protein